MQNFFKNHRLAAIITTSLAILIAVIIAVVIINRNPYGTSTSIDNLSEIIDNLPRTQSQLVTRQLYQVLALNNENPPTSGAIARTEPVTISYNTDTQVHYNSFIVDLPAIEQSYQVQLEWSPITDNPNLSGYSVVVTCLTNPALIIYSNFTNCQDGLSSSSDSTYNATYENLGQYLPYSSTTTDGLAFTISVQFNYATGGQELQILANNCGDAAVKDTLLEAAQSYISTLGFNPDYFDYNIPNLYNNCAIE